MQLRKFIAAISATVMIGITAITASISHSDSIFGSSAAVNQNWYADSVAFVETTLAQSWQPGRTWASNFADEDATAETFDLVNAEYDVDGSTPVVVATDPALTTTVLTKEPLRDYHVRARYKVAAAAGFTLADSIHYLVGRISNFDNRSMQAIDGWNSTGFLWLRSFVNGVSGTAGNEWIAKTTLGLDNENVEDFRYLETELTDDLMRVRSWVEGDEIPPWQFQRRSRPAGAVNTVDDPTPGPAGWGSWKAGAKLQELVVTELIRMDDNVLRNATFQDIDNSVPTLPAYWNRDRTAEQIGVGESATVANVADWTGRVRPALRVVSNGGLPFGFRQTVFARHGRTIAVSRLMPHPFARFGPEIEVTIWSKGVGITNSSPSEVNLAGYVAIKYFAADDGVEQGQFEDPAANVHYVALGPRVDGRGSWGWHLTRVRMQLVDWWRMAWLTIHIGLHDATSAGEVWFVDPVVKVVG